MATWQIGSHIITNENAHARQSPKKAAIAAVSSPIKTRAPLGSLNTNSKTPQRSRPQLAPSPLKRTAETLADTRTDSHAKRRKTRPTNQASTIAALPTQDVRNRQTRDLEWTIDQHGRPKTNPPTSSIYTTPRTRNSLSDESDSGQDSATSFTSLINYDGVAKPPRTRRQQQQHPAPPSRSEVLRLILRIASYKVLSNQVHTPFDSLKIVPPHQPQTADHNAQTPFRRSTRLPDSSASPELPTGPDLPRAKAHRQSDWDATPKARIGLQASLSGSESAYRFCVPPPSLPLGTPGRDILADDFMVRVRPGGIHERKSSESTIIAGKLT